MSDWASTELDTIGGADELEIASLRSDGSLRPYVIIWVVRADDQIYVRSARGPDNGWYRRAKASGAGRIRAGGLERDVTFAQADSDAHDRIDAAYHGKYDHYGASLVDPVVGQDAAAVTLRIEPRSD